MRRVSALLLILGVLSGPLIAQPDWLELQTGVTTGDGTAIDRRAANTFTVCTEWIGTVTAGVITIEEAHQDDYSGTWSSLATVSFVADSQECVHLNEAPYGAIRGRVSTTVVGGTVTVRARGNR